MKNLSRRLASLTFAVFVGMAAHAQESSVDRVSVSFRDPSRPGKVKVNAMLGAITVRGYDGKEVIVEARPRGAKPSKEKARQPSDADAQGEAAQSNGLKRIGIAGTGFTVEEDDNVISISAGPPGRPVDLILQTPFVTSLKLNSRNSGDILVEKVEGEIEAACLNGKVTLTHVSGVVVAHSLNGAVIVHLDKVTPDQPMSFTTLNGEIDVTLPAGIQAKVRLESQNGSISSEFEIGLEKSASPPAEQGRKHRITFEKGIVGSINGGGAEFHFKSVNGNIQIRKAQQ